MRDDVFEECRRRRRVDDDDGRDSEFPIFPGVQSLLLGFPHWLALVIFLGIWRLIQDYVSSPRIMGHSMELHPLAAIFGVMAGSEVAGILGIFLSIPVMASLRIVFRRWRLYAEKRKFGPLDEYVLGSQVGLKK